MITWEQWPESLKVTLREAKPVAGGPARAGARAQVCSICIGNGRILTVDGGTRPCLCRHARRAA